MRNKGTNVCKALQRQYLTRQLTLNGNRDAGKGGVRTKDSEWDCLGLIPALPLPSYMRSESHFTHLS
jgi:hypothetical protein